MNRIRIYLILDELDTIQNFQELNVSTNSFHLLTIENLTWFLKFLKEFQIKNHKHSKISISLDLIFLIGSYLNKRDYSALLEYENLIQEPNKMKESAFPEVFQPNPHKNLCGLSIICCSLETF